MSQEFRQLGTKKIYQGRIFELKKVHVRAPDGHEFKHDVIFHPGASVIVPMIRKDQFVLIKQFRAAAGDKLWEFPAGTLEKNESPLSCAKREVAEETGFQGKKWRKLISFYSAPGISTEYMYIYLAEDLFPVKMSRDRDEYLETRIVSFSRLKKMILSGMIIDAKTIVAFYAYCLQFKKK